MSPYQNLRPTPESRTFRINKPGGAFVHVTRPCNGIQQAPVVENLLSQGASILIQDTLCPVACDCGVNCSGCAGNWPITRINGHDNNEQRVTGSSYWAVFGGKSQAVEWQGQRIGTLHEDDEARYLMIGGLSPSGTDNPRSEQTIDTLESIIAILEENGMDISHVVRTWFYLDHILEWYDRFNIIRNRFFMKHRVFDGLVPASTGIGCANSNGSAVVAKVLAIQPKAGPSPMVVASPLQCSAYDYKSAFSRAVEVELPSHRQLYISGTASIAPDGRTIHIGDLLAQLDKTMEVVGEILMSRGYNWADTTRSIAYVRRPEDMGVVREMLERHPIGRQPLLIMQSDICRDDLLFELELDAAR